MKLWISLVVTHRERRLCRKSVCPPARDANATSCQRDVRSRSVSTAEVDADDSRPPVPDLKGTVDRAYDAL